MKVFNIRDYGARTCDWLLTKNIQQAIDDCFLAGGGRVVIPSGIYITGGLRIRSGVELYLETGAILKGSRNAEDYFDYLKDTIEPVTIEPIGYDQPTGRSSVCTSRWCNALIRAIDAHDFAIIGEKGSFIDGDNSIDLYSIERPRGAHGICAWRCKNMRFEGYTFMNSGNWTYALFQSQNITIRNIAIQGGEDGIDMRTCDNVLIEDSNINTGDDAVAGYDNNDVIVRNCHLNSACMPVRIGGNNFLVENCVSDERNFAPRGFLSLEEAKNGCSLVNGRHEMRAAFSYYCDFRAPLRKTPEHIVIRNCRFEQTRETVRLEFTGLNRWCRQRALKEITFENCYMGDLYYTGMLWGDAEDKVICRFKNVTFACREGMDHVPLLVVGNVEKLLFEDCTFEGYTHKPTLLLGTNDLANIEVVRSGDVEIKPATFDECIAAHPGGVAFADQGKFIFWDLKDPDAPPAEGDETLKKILAPLCHGYASIG